MFYFSVLFEKQNTGKGMVMYKDMGRGNKYLSDHRSVRYETVMSTEECALICSQDSTCTMFYVQTFGTGSDAHMECVYEQ